MEVKCPRCGKSDTVESSPSGGYECSLCKSGFGRCENFDKTIIRSITFSISPVFVNSWTVCIKERGDGAYFDSIYGTDRRKGRITRERWEMFLDSLLSDAYIDSWKPMYFSASEMKGAIWDMSIKLRYKHFVAYKGVGCLPPYWEEFVSTVRELIKNPDSDIQSRQ